MSTEPNTISVWDVLESNPQQAANLRVRAALMRQISTTLSEQGLTQAEAARRCGVSQPRISQLMNGQIASFSLDALVNIAAALGLTVEIR